MQSFLFTVHRSQWREHWIWVYSRSLSCWLKVLIEHRVCIICEVEWPKSCWNNVPYIVRVQKGIRAMLFVNRTGRLIVAGNVLGFFMGSGNVIPFSVDLSDFCRSFREERNITIKMYITHHVLLINEVYEVIKRNSLFDIWTTVWYKIIFRTQIEWTASFVGS